MIILYFMYKCLIHVPWCSCCYTSMSTEFLANFLSNSPCNLVCVRVWRLWEKWLRWIGYRWGRSLLIILLLRWIGYRWARSLIYCYWDGYDTDEPGVLSTVIEMDRIQMSPESYLLLLRWIWYRWARSLIYCYWDGSDTDEPGVLSTVIEMDRIQMRPESAYHTVIEMDMIQMSPESYLLLLRWIGYRWARSLIYCYWDGSDTDEPGVLSYCITGHTKRLGQVGASKLKHRKTKICIFTRPWIYMPWNFDNPGCNITEPLIPPKMYNKSFIFWICIWSRRTTSIH